MPKKQRNAFYFYMVDYKEQKQKQGIQMNMQEAAEAAGPLWKDAPPAVRAKFEALAKKNKANEKKYTSHGVSYEQLDEEEREKRAAEENERKDIKNIVKLKAFDMSVLNEDFYIIDVNYYCKYSVQRYSVRNEHRDINQDINYLIGELTVLRFNLEEGIKDNYYEMINPKYIPTGYTADAKEGSIEYALDMPDESNPSDYRKILANIMDYLTQKDRGATVLPPLFTLPDKVAPVKNFILQMCDGCEDESLFRVYKLDFLFYTLINAIKSREEDGFPKESLAMVQLKKDTFNYSPGLGCPHHEELDKANKCSLSRAKCWTFTVLDSCCPVVNVDMVPGRHLPADLDMNGIMAIKEQKKGRTEARVAGFPIPSSCDTSTVNDSYMDSSMNSSVDTVKKEKRVHKPLRMPNQDYSQHIRPAPELSESNFPKLNVPIGRGRGLAGSFGRMNIKK